MIKRILALILLAGLLSACSPPCSRMITEIAKFECCAVEYCGIDVNPYMAEGRGFTEADFRCIDKCMSEE